MKIVHLIDYFEPKLGYQEYFLAKYQQKLGHQVLVVTSDRYYPFHFYQETYAKILGERIVGIGKSQEEGIDVLRLSALYEYKQSGQLILNGILRALSEYKPDVVHCHSLLSTTAFQAALFKGKCKYKLIFDSHIADFNTNVNKTILGRLYNYLFLKPFLIPQVRKNSDGIFAIADPEREFVHRYFGLRKKEIGIINLGVDTNLFKQSYTDRTIFRKKLKLDSNDICLIFSGKILPGKNIETLFWALKKMNNYKAKLIIIGGGDSEYLVQLKKSAKELKISVLWLDFVPNRKLASYYNAADIAVWPGDPSISFLEAMATGLPLVVPKWRGTDYLKSSGGVLYFDKSDSDSLYRKLKILTEDTNYRVKIGQNSQKFIKNHLSWEIITEKVLNFYKI